MNSVTTEQCIVGGTQAVHLQIKIQEIRHRFSVKTRAVARHKHAFQWQILFIPKVTEVIVTFCELCVSFWQWTTYVLHVGYSQRILFADNRLALLKKSVAAYICISATGRISTQARL